MTVIRPGEAVIVENGPERVKNRRFKELRGALPPDGAPEAIDLGWTQRPEAARRQAPEVDAAVPDPPQLLDRVPDRLQHPADLAVPALGDPDLEPGVLPRLHDADLGRSGTAAVDVDATGEPFERLRVGKPAHLGPVGLFHPRGGVHEVPGELPVVRQEQESLAVEVQTADGIDAHPDSREEIAYRTASLRIA